ncbi:MarR family winged helix-turn-helix transcriptional regulator [Leifsonia aquatica]|uniref:MarR family winged helix-turn-helix transcriptional regulator n=1 Tax=Leifsonia aquatica TaxID=144185 RepID=UPI00046917AE|nr:MarR family transcriptional regulator [Leifsonia aquatica]
MTVPAADLDAVLRAANVLLGVAARSVLDVEDEVTSPQLRVLVLIATNGPRTPGDIATALGVHPSNATRTGDKLVRAGYAERTGDPRDRRSVRLVLTPTGADLVTRVISRRRAALADVLESLPETERVAAAAAFAAFARAAEEAAGITAVDDGRFTLLLPGDRPGPGVAGKDS